MNRILFLFSFLIIHSYILSQNVTQIDSIKSVLVKTHDVNLKINLYLELSNLYYHTNNDTAIIMARNALKLSKNINSEESLAKAHLLLGHLEVRRDSLELAVSEYYNSIDYYTKVNEVKSICDISVILGNIYFVKGSYPKAMQLYLEALNLSEQINYKSKLPSCINNIGIVYFTQKEYTRALEFFTHSLTLFEEQHDSLNIALTLGNIGSIYLQFNNLNIANNYYLSSMRLYRLMNDNDGLALSLLQLSEIYLKNNQPDSALLYIEKSQILYDNTNLNYRGPRSPRYAETQLKMAKAFMLKKEWVPAITYLRNSYNIASNTLQNEIIMQSSGLLSKIFDSLHTIDSSYKYFKIFKYYSDSLLNEDNIKRLALMDFQNKLEQQKKDSDFVNKVEEINQNRKNILYILVFLILVFTLALFVLLYKIEKNGKSKIEIEKKQLKKDIDFKNREITTHVLYLLKKNEFILNISEKLKKLIPVVKPQNKKLIADVINELKTGTSNDSWAEFEIRFQQVHTSFYENLNIKYPDLSPNELRLCAFLKLNMTTKDISAITYQSLNSIEMARSRLRKKLNLTKSDNLILFLNKL